MFGIASLNWVPIAALLLIGGIVLVYVFVFGYVQGFAKGVESARKPEHQYVPKLFVALGVCLLVIGIVLAVEQAVFLRGAIHTSGKVVDMLESTTRDREIGRAHV